MNTLHKNELQIRGLKVRTTNAVEATGDGKLGKLWAEFSERIQPVMSESKVYAVYHEYESDASGAYTVLLGGESVALADIEGLQQTTIQAGEYRQFTAQGSMPQTTIQLWQDIWRYYEQSEHQRAYTTDFELYDSPENVSIFIAEK